MTDREFQIETRFVMVEKSPGYFTVLIKEAFNRGSERPFLVRNCFDLKDVYVAYECINMKFNSKKDSTKISKYYIVVDGSPDIQGYILPKNICQKI